MKTAPVAFDRAGEIDFTVCDNRATLTWLAQLASARAAPLAVEGEEQENPTVVAFDLDPGPPADVIGLPPDRDPPARAAHRVGPRELPEDVGLEGDAGVRAPERGRTGYDRTQPFAHAVALLLESTPTGWSPG